MNGTTFGPRKRGKPGPGPGFPGLTGVCSSRSLRDVPPVATHSSEIQYLFENVADFAAERDLVLVFVLKNLPAGGGQAAALARILDRWDRDHPDPYLGHHWPAMD